MGSETSVKRQIYPVIGIPGGIVGDDIYFACNARHDVMNAVIAAASAFKFKGKTYTPERQGKRVSIVLGVYGPPGRDEVLESLVSENNGVISYERMQEQAEDVAPRLAQLACNPGQTLQIANGIPGILTDRELGLIILDE